MAPALKLERDYFKNTTNGFMALKLFLNCHSFVMVSLTPCCGEEKPVENLLWWRGRRGPEESCRASCYFLTW